jgi:hypothetical protein
MVIHKKNVMSMLEQFNVMSMLEQFNVMSMLEQFNVMSMLEQFNESEEYVMNYGKLYTFAHNGVINGSFPCIFPSFFKFTSLSVLPLAKFFKPCLFLNYTHKYRKPYLR